MNRIARRSLSLARLPRLARGAVIALVLALIVAAPAAAGQPTRTVHDLQGFVIPAGDACAFAVEGQPSRVGFVAKTVFSDGSVMSSVRSVGQYVNLETGATFPIEDTYRELDQYDPATGIYVVTGSGQFSEYFWPGDVGPFGVVGSNAVFYHFVGTQSFTWDSNTGQYANWVTAGTFTDICAALS